jgi:hypothetical protein
MAFQWCQWYMYMRLTQVPEGLARVWGKHSRAKLAHMYAYMHV